MKKQILSLILANHHKMDRSLKKKILIGIGVLSVFYLVILGALSYTAIQTGRYLIAKAPNQEQLVTIVQNVNLQSQKVAGNLVSIGCLEQVQGLFNVQTWLKIPLSENIEKIIGSCFQFNIKT